MSKNNLDKLEKKIMQLQAALERTSSMIASMEAKRNVLESQINELNREVNMIRMEDFHTRLTAAGINLKDLNLTQAAQLLGENFREPSEKDDHSSNPVFADSSVKPDGIVGG